MKSFVKEKFLWVLLVVLHHFGFHCWMHLNTLKNLNHVQASILRGQKKTPKSFAVFESRENFFFAWGLVLSAPTKASLNNNNK